jgi:hypothetical protein
VPLSLAGGPFVEHNFIWEDYAEIVAQRLRGKLSCCGKGIQLDAVFIYVFLK